MKKALFVAVLLICLQAFGEIDFRGAVEMRIIAVNGTIATVTNYRPDVDNSATIDCELQNNGTLGHIALLKLVNDKYYCLDTGKEYKEPPPKGDKK
jgi:hypothetical protein